MQPGSAIVCMSACTGARACIATPAVSLNHCRKPSYSGQLEATHNHTDTYNPPTRTRTHTQLYRHRHKCPVVFMACVLNAWPSIKLFSFSNSCSRGATTDWLDYDWPIFTDQLVGSKKTDQEGWSNDARQDSFLTLSLSSCFCLYIAVSFAVLLVYGILEHLGLRLCESSFTFKLWSGCIHAKFDIVKKAGGVVPQGGLSYLSYEDKLCHVESCNSPCSCWCKMAEMSVKQLQQDVDCNDRKKLSLNFSGPRWVALKTNEKCIILNFRGKCCV